MSFRLLPSVLRHAPRLKTRGIEILRDPQTNKGTSYTLRERQLLGIHGLLPPNPQNQMVEAQRILTNLYQLDDNLSRYNMLMSLQDRNEKLFYRVLRQHLEYCLPLVYTPTVASACLHFGSVFRRPRGLYITIQDRGHIYTLLRNWPTDQVKAVVMTDGERIMGFGDLGANGMAISISQAALYVALGGLQPQNCLPIMLDVGTDNTELLKDEFYAGLRRTRARGDEYVSFIDEVMEALRTHYGPQVCIQFADFKNDNAFFFMDRYSKDYVTFNDDVQGSATITLAGLMSSSKLTGKSLYENTYLFYGAGGAAIGTARLLVDAIKESGHSEEEAKSRIYLMDSKGLVSTNRFIGGLTELKYEFARTDISSSGTLLDLVREIRPSVLIGVSAQRGAFTRDILREMSLINKMPVIFSLSNPPDVAECTAEMAFKATEWNCVFIGGSVSDPVKTPLGQIFIPGQGNNCYIFPGIVSALVNAGIHPLTDKLLLTAAKTLSSLVTDEELTQRNMYPSISKLQHISKMVARAVIDEALQDGIANVHPRPTDVMGLIEYSYYDHNYVDFSPEVY